MQDCICQSQHSSPQFYIQNVCSVVHLRVMQQIHWSVVWKYLSIFIFFLLLQEDNTQNLKQETTLSQNLKSVQMSVTCSLGMCKYLRKRIELPHHYGDLKLVWTLHVYLFFQWKKTELRRNKIAAITATTTICPIINWAPCQALNDKVQYYKVGLQHP